MNLYRIIKMFMALMCSMLLGYQTYASSVDLLEQSLEQKSALWEKTQTKLLKKIDKQIEKEQKKASDFDKIVDKAVKKTRKAFNKQRKLYSKILSKETQEEQLELLDKKLRKIEKLDPAFANAISQLSEEEIIDEMIQQNESLVQIEEHKVAQLLKLKEDYASFEEFLIDYRAQIAQVKSIDRSDYDAIMMIVTILVVAAAVQAVFYLYAAVSALGVVAGVVVFSLWAFTDVPFSLRVRRRS